MLNAHLNTYKVHISFTEAEVSHFFLSSVVHSFVVESQDNSSILTDFTSFYTLPSQVIQFACDNDEQK